MSGIDVVGKGSSWPAGDGEMARRVRAQDWAATPLGPLKGWPQSRRTAVDLMLASSHAMCLAWGPERTFLYNDAYVAILGKRHPGALGLPFREAWPDVWEEIDGMEEANGRHSDSQDGEDEDGEVSIEGDEEVESDGDESEDNTSQGQPAYKRVKTT